jgi:hypothetical protein
MRLGAIEGDTMPEIVRRPGDIQPGDLFEDCRFHPCLCDDISDDGTHIFGISLVDGSTWQCSISGCGVRKLTVAEAWRWKSDGPALELTLPSGRVISDVTENAVRSALEGEDSAILGIDPHAYIRCAKQTEWPGGYLLEYQEGSAAQRYKTVDGPFPLDRILTAFMKYLRRDRSWQSDFQWVRTEP